MPNDDKDEQMITVKASTLRLLLRLCMVDKEAAMWGQELFLWRGAYAELEAALEGLSRR